MKNSKVTPAESKASRKKIHKPHDLRDQPWTSKDWNKAFTEVRAELNKKLASNRGYLKHWCGPSDRVQSSDKNDMKAPKIVVLTRPVAEEVERKRYMHMEYRAQCDAIAHRPLHNEAQREKNEKTASANKSIGPVAYELQIPFQSRHYSSEKKYRYYYSFGDQMTSQWSFAFKVHVRKLYNLPLIKHPWNRKLLLKLFIYQGSLFHKTV